MALEHQLLTHEILGAAIDVHRSLGPGFLEVIYAKALEVELAARRIHFERELSVPVFYRGVEVGRHRIDLLVARTIVVELKAIRALENVHFAVVRSYLSALGLEHGLLLNFAGLTVIAKRVSSLRLSRVLPGFLGS
jgi:GxxExxY protein